MVDKKQFGNYIKEKRVAIGMTQEEFAEQLYISPTAVSKWERGKTYPDITIISQICAILKISEHEFISACDDTSARKTAYEAEKYQEYYKVRKIKLKIWNGMFIAAFSMCFIVTFAISQLQFLFVCASVLGMPYSVFVLPYYIRKEKMLMVLLGFHISLLSTVLLLNIIAGGNIAAIMSSLGETLLFGLWFLGIWGISRFSKYRLSLNFIFVGAYWILYPYINALLAQGGLQFYHIFSLLDILIYGVVIILGISLFVLQRKQIIKTTQTIDDFKIILED